jgi:Cytochrome c7 and related cytochrome c
MKGARLSVVIVVGAAAGVGALAGWATAASGPGARADVDGGASSGPAASGARAVAVANAAASPPSPLIFPAQTIPLAFDHARHLKLGARCETCHVAAPTSTSAADDLIPAEAACRACHEIDRTAPAKVVPPGAPAARCDACHVGWMPPPGPAGAFAEPPRVRVTPPNLKFNHRLHVSRGMGCEACHTNVALEGLATRDDLPKMATCLACHDGKQTTSRCGACHLTEPDGRLRTNLASAATAALGLAGTGPLEPSGVLRGFDAHGPTFARDHAQAGREEGYCLSCHKRSECVDCHGGTVRPMDIHPSDYVSLHGNDARRNTPDCSSCHREQSFCIACHQRAGVAPDATGGVPGTPARNPFGTGTQEKTFHPPGWVREDAAAGPSGHSRQARLNIRSCVSCHREESCLSCHSADPTRGPGVSPHGPAFWGTARCKALSSRNRRACLKCHALSAPELDCEMP